MAEAGTRDVRRSYHQHRRFAPLLARTGWISLSTASSIFAPLNRAVYLPTSLHAQPWFWFRCKGNT